MSLVKRKRKYRISRKYQKLFSAGPAEKTFAGVENVEYYSPQEDAENRVYIHQTSDWPKFRWIEEVISAPLALVRHRQGRLIGPARRPSLIR